MKKLLIFLNDYKKESILGPLFKLLEASFELIVPLVVASIVDVGIEKGDKAYVVSRCLWLVALDLVGLICSITAQYFAAKAAVGFGTGVRKELFAHIQRLGFAQADQVGTATLITRITGDVNQVQSGVNMVLRLFLRSPFIVFGAMVMAFTVDRPSAMVFVVLIPILSVMVSVIVVVGIKLFRAIQTGLDRLMLRTRENLTGVRVIRAFRREKAEQRHFSEDSDRLLRFQLLTGRITGLLNPLTFLTVNLGMIVLIYTGALRVSSGIITQGAVIALVNYMSQILVELVKLANLVIIVARGFASGGRIATVLALPVSGGDKIGSIAVGDPVQSNEVTPYIEFRQVYFRYSVAAGDALSGISFSVKRGETIGIIGGTGAGKSTLVHLLPRFYEVGTGAIYLDDQDVRSLPVEALREQ
ncbi:MAG: ABC transporter ATP-binding protein, partial [Lachnospiraceae bacterium]|nr:ABC transporter ATP-binding protein [Lachnospiraceae bacterium]